ncbi:MAG: outer membrane beta-barrel protein [Niabella sp.]
MKRFLNQYLFIQILLISLTLRLSAQQFTIGGNLSDGVTAITYANMELRNVFDTAYIQYTLSDSLGFYKFDISRTGNYIIKISHTGFPDLVTDTIRIIPDKKQYTLDIALERKGTAMQEVVITSKKPLLETEKGKLIFNVQNSALTSGQTAFDMLKKLPGVTVGQNEDILFKGSPGINMMIDGKMTYLSGNQLTNYLKGMSAEDINKIELITTPSSEFDAAGNAGIINIIPKRSLKKGYAVDLRTSVSKGKYWMVNENISVSLRTKKLNLYGSYDFNTPHSFYEGTSGNNYSNNGSYLQLSRNNNRAYKVKYYTRRAGADWQFFPKHNISIGYHGYFDDFKSFNNSTVKNRDHSGNLQSYMLSQNNIIEPYHFDALSFNYKFDLDTLGKKITADANYTSYRNFSDGLMTTRNFNAGGVFLNKNILRSHQPGFVEIASAKADAELPFRKFSIKTGIKYAEVANDNQYRFDSLQSGNYVEIPSVSNHFKYTERIAAVYFSGTKKLNKTNVEAGLRMEYTNADGRTVKQDITNKWQYAKLFPSLAVEQIINNNNKIDFSLSRRINRPAYTELNPVRWYTDLYFYWSGNPELLPELAWIYALNYSLKKKYIFTIAYNNSIHYINRRLDIDDDGVIKTQSDNFGNRHRFDLTVSAPARLWNFWDIQLFTGVNYTSYPISLLSGERRASLWAVTVSLQQDISLPNDFKINIASYFFSSELRGIYITRPAGFVNSGIKKSLLKKKLEAQLTLSDVFNTNRYRASSQTNITNYYYNDKPYSRIIGLSLKYHLGGELIKSNDKRIEEQERL